MPFQSQLPKTSQKLSQKQMLTPGLLQSIKMMTVPLVTLKEMIHQEVEKNPALEIVREAEDNDKLGEQVSQIEDDSYTELYREEYDPGYLTGSKGTADSKQGFLEGTISRPLSLHDHLLEQLHLLSIEQPVADLAEKIVWNLDDDGFHRESPELLNGGKKDIVLTTALKVVRGLEPIGCACLNWKESLLAQAEELGDGPEHFSRYIEDAFPLLEKKKADVVRKELNVSAEEWEDWEEYVQNLTPFPGREYSTATSEFIVPELEVRKINGDYAIVINDEIVPVLRIDPEFELLKNRNKKDKETTRFVAEKTREGRSFINSLRQRENTLLRTATAIVEFQREFFSRGPRYLKPLILKDIADELELHETTISRITTNKYIQTEWGIFELKYFFSHSVSGSGGEGVSRIAVHEMIKEIISNASPDMSLTDQKIADLLARRGVSLSRRTITKYRRQLDLPSFFKR